MKSIGPTWSGARLATATPTLWRFFSRHSRVSTLDSKRSRFFALFHLRWRRELCVVQHHIYAINACFAHEYQVLFAFVVLNACHNNEIALRRTLAEILFDYGYLLFVWCGDKFQLNLHQCRSAGVRRLLPTIACNVPLNVLAWRWMCRLTSTMRLVRHWFFEQIDLIESKRFRCDYLDVFLSKYSSRRIVPKNKFAGLFFFRIIPTSSPYYLPISSHFQLFCYPQA